MTGKVISVEMVECDDEFVYNLEVDDVEHRKNYYADGVLVSNCHSLSGTGEEALLKLIEQPPPRVIFILATTEFHNMRDTIRSRCQDHLFRKVYWKAIYDHLVDIARREGVTASEEALRLCARQAHGAVRNGLQNLDKLIAYAAGRPITGEIAQEAFGTVDEDWYFRLVGCVAGEDGKPRATEGYKIINRLVSSGIDVRMALDGLTEHLRSLLLAMTSKDTSGIIYLTDEEKKRLVEQKTRFTPGKVAAMTGLLTEAYRGLAYGISEETVLDQWFIQSILKCNEQP